MITRTVTYLHHQTSEDSRLGGWFLGVGAAIGLLGSIAFAHLLLATVAAAYMLGAIMLAGGMLQMLHAFRMQRPGRIALWGLSGLFYIAAATLVLCRPLFAAMIVTLLLAMSLGASGLVRCILAVGHRYKGWGWTFVSGGISMMAATVIVMNWPFDAVWVLGMVLAVDLLMQGITFMLLGLALRQGAAV